MKFIWLIFGGLVVAMLGLLPKLEKPAADNAGTSAGPGKSKELAPVIAVVTSHHEARRLSRNMAQRDSIVFFAMQQLGTNYCYAGTTPETGFDCSGFVQYVFARFGVAMPHSTALLIDVGQPVPREEALPGDIVVFTGTAATATTPGHAGIVISAGPKGPMRFVHSSSARRESGVKVSQVEGTDYERRFMQVRRVLGVGKIGAGKVKRSIAPPPALPIPAPKPSPAASVPPAASAVVPVVAPTAKKPVVKAARKASRPAARRKATAKSTSSRARKAPAKRRAVPAKAKKRPAVSTASKRKTQRR